MLRLELFLADQQSLVPRSSGRSIGVQAYWSPPPPRPPRRSISSGSFYRRAV